MSDFQLVEKEWIQDSSFPQKDVLSSSQEKQKLAQKIHRATSLGNIENHKVFILFEDGKGLKKVFTTIWAQTREKIVLKRGLSIPVNRIYDIRFS
ncbi:MAG: hypothetical protein N4A46_03200 [Schleiferiaceae bacterium]|nr:hypothetical protein [Schleiferiaceae bacterium]